MEESQSLQTHIRSVAFFACSSPIGVAIGMFLLYLHHFLDLLKVYFFLTDIKTSYTNVANITPPLIT